MLYKELVLNVHTLYKHKNIAFAQAWIVTSFKILLISSLCTCCIIMDKLEIYPIPALGQKIMSVLNCSYQSKFLFEV